MARHNGDDQMATDLMRWNYRGQIVSPATARRICGDWHDGMDSWLYAVGSRLTEHDTIPQYMASEALLDIRRDMKGLPKDSFYYRLQLDALQHYITANTVPDEEV